MTKVQKIPNWVPALISPVIEIVKAQFVSKIDDEDLRLVVSDALDTVVSTAVVLSDEDPSDGEQIKKLFLSFANTSIADFVEDKVEDAINKIENETIRVPLQTLRVPVVNMIRVVTDEDPGNKEQLEKLWIEFIKNDEVQIVLLGIVDKLIEANLKDTVKTIALALWSILKPIIRGELDKF